MGWTDLFKSRSLKLRPDPRIRWFGKLPTYADYYSSKADEEWAVEFNNWMINGYQKYHSRRQDHSQKSRLPLCGCIVRLPKTAMTVFASIQDFGGDVRGRPFPLAFYAGVPTNMWPGPTSERIEGALRVLRELHALRDKVVKFINAPGHFDTVFADREVLIDVLEETGTDDAWIKAGRSVALSDWFEGASEGLAATDLDAWRRVTRRMGDSIAAFESKTFDPTLRFPLAMTVPLSPQVTGWVHWLERRMDLKRRFLSILISGEPGVSVGRLSVSSRELSEDDFLLLTSLSHTLTYVDDLCRVTPPNNGDLNPSAPAADAPPSPSNPTTAATPTTEASATQMSTETAVAAAPPKSTESWYDFIVGNAAT